MENIDIRKINNDLYAAKYSRSIMFPNYGGKEYKDLWKVIRKNNEILKQAIEVVRNKWDTANIFAGTSIVDGILRDYKNVDKTIYLDVVEKICKDEELAKFGYNKCSFLLMAMSNHNIKLSDEQKKFAIEEAMNISGSVREKLSGAMFTSLRVHGSGPFDLRFQILCNPNFRDEAGDLIYAFYTDEKYCSIMNEISLEVDNLYNNYKKAKEGFLTTYRISLLTDDRIKEAIADKEIAGEVVEILADMRTMQELRDVKGVDYSGEAYFPIGSPANTEKELDKEL